MPSRVKQLFATKISRGIFQKIKQKNVLFFFSILFLIFTFFAFPAQANAETRYYNNATADGDWSNLSNWWLDDTFTVPSPVLPTSEDQVVLSASVTGNSGDPISLFSLSTISLASIENVGTIEVSSLVDISGDSFLGNGVTLNAPSASVTFSSYAYSAPGSSVYAYQITFSHDAHNEGELTLNESIPGGVIRFNDRSYNAATISGAGGNNVEFINESRNHATGIINATTTFNDTSYNAGTINSFTKFLGSSYNSGSGAITSPLMTIFLGASAANAGTINGDACFTAVDLNTGTVSGSATICGAGSKFFHSPTDDGDWSNLNNWWDDSNYTIQSLIFPTVATDVSVSSKNITQHSVDVGSTVKSLTLNGTSYFAIAIGTTDGIVLNDTSSIGDVDITGDVRFNNSSSMYYGTISGNATFNTTAYDQIGSSVPTSGVFTMSSGAIWSTEISGTVYDSNNVQVTSYVFNGPTEPDIDINGDAVFNGNPLRNSHTVNGNATFNLGSTNEGTVIGNATFNDFSHNFGNINGDMYLNTEYYLNGSSTPTGGVLTINGEGVWSGIVSGSVYGSDMALITQYVFNDNSYAQSDISANTVIFNDNSHFDSGSITAEVTFNDTSYNTGTINGDTLFNTNYYDETNDIYPVDGTLTVSGSRSLSGVYNGDVYVPGSGMITRIIVDEYVFRDSGVNSASLTGNARFLDTSTNQGEGVITGDACFASTATNYGTVSGSTTVCPTKLYFHNATNNSYWHDTLNWFTDSAYTIPAGIIPTSEYDVYVGVGETIIQNNGGSQASAKSLHVTDGLVEGFDITVSDYAQFTGTAQNGLIIYGNACFAPTAVNNGSVSGVTSVCGNYFHNSVDGEWHTLGNWWSNDIFTIPAETVPSVDDDIIVTSAIEANSGGPISIRSATFNGSSYLGYSVTLTVSQGAVFNNSSYINGGAVFGTTTFNTDFYDAVDSTKPTSGVFNINNQAWSGVVDGVIIGSDSEPITKYVFSGNAFNNGGTLYRNSEFYDTSYNNGTIDGDACFAPTASNSGTVTGNVSVCYVPDLPPTITLVSATTTPTTATITWTSSESATYDVEYGLTTSYGSSIGATGSTTYIATITGLTQNTLYHFKINGVDAGSNSTSTVDATFTTTIAPDITPPVISSITTSGITDVAATISWTTNESATSSVQYGLTTSYGSQSSIGSLNTNHSISLSSLAQSSVYHYRVISTDAVGNVATSSDQTFTTSATVVPTSGGSTGGSSSGSAPASGSSGTSGGGVYIIYGNGQNNASSTASSNQNSLANNASSTSGVGNGIGNGQGSLPQNNLYVFTINRSLWMIGADVKQIQRYLNTHGFPVANYGVGSLGKETTKFGLATKQAIIRYQKAHKISPAIGYFGIKTRAAFNAGL